MTLSLCFVVIIKNYYKIKNENNLNKKKVKRKQKYNITGFN